jgi:hypothetical protein
LLAGREKCRRYWGEESIGRVNNLFMRSIISNLRSHYSNCWVQGYKNCDPYRNSQGMKWVIAFRNTILLIAIAYSPTGSSQTASGQSPFYADNVKKVDGIIRVVRAFCDSIKPVEVSERNIKFDRQYILYVNKLFNTVTSDKAFARDAKKNDLVLTGSLNAGLIGFREYKFYPPNGYLAISIFLSVIDDNIFYKKIIIESPLSREGARDDQPIPFFDFLYLKKEILPVIDFPIKDCADCDSLMVDTLYRPIFNDMANKYPAYKFVPNGSNDPIKSFLFQRSYLQSSTYNNKVAPDIFIQLIKLNEYDAIKSLLYSPNQLMAVNACESLVYLKNKSNLAINTPDDAKMKEIVNSDTPIPVFCGPDCKPTNFSYNTLKIKEKDVVEKYQSALD